MTDPRDALDAIGLLPDTEIDVADAALQLARIDAPEADWLRARAHLSELARHAAALPPTEDLATRAEALSGLLATRHRYAGDADNYDDLANANLVRVIERRRGLPVALGVLWLHAARAAGWTAYGVDFPAHFLIALGAGRSQLVLDVFHGGAPLGSADLRALLKRIAGEDAELRPGLLRPMSTRGVLLRLQNNIVTRRLQAQDLEGALQCIDGMLRFAPDQSMLWRQSGALNQQLGQIAAALRCYDRFLALVPEGDAAAQVRTAIGELRKRLN